MRLIHSLCAVAVCCFFNLQAHAQQVKPLKITWTSPRVISDSKKLVHFEGAFYDNQSSQPVYSTFIPVEPSGSYAVTLANAVYEPLSSEEAALVTGDVPLVIALNSRKAYDRNNTLLAVSLIPIRKDAGNRLEKLVSADLVLTELPALNALHREASAQRTYASSSVLSTGNWYKIGVTNEGVYKLSYSFLKALGIPVSSVNPNNIRLYGNGGGMLPEANSVPRIDDLAENAIEVTGASDGVLDSTDYVLFYGQSPVKWKYDSTDTRFHHALNLYSDTTYYFITVDLGPGKRISSQSSLPNAPTHVVSSFDDYVYHEVDKVNILKSGREWVGEAFDILSTQTFNLTVPNIDTSVPTYFASLVMAQSRTASAFSVSLNGNSYSQGLPAFTDDAFHPAASTSLLKDSLALTDNITLTYTYTKTSADALAWLNYFEFNFRRLLSLPAAQMMFRDKRSAGSGHIAEYHMSNCTSATTVWDITDPRNVKTQLYDLSQGVGIFRSAADRMNQYLAFPGSTFFVPVAKGKVPNQNLHGIAEAEMLIVVPQFMMAEANRLADFHREKDGLNVVLATPQQIYNEFSSGSQDISAIRDFSKMLYDRAAGDTTRQLKYLLLFGDGSYDPKKRVTNNENLVPTYESKESLTPLNSYVSDDFYGFMNDQEGDWSGNDLLDLCIGRFPVKTLDEARGVVNKMLNYNKVYGDWRNILAFVSDDQDQGETIFVEDSEGLTSLVTGTNRTYNIEKIYADSYKQISTPGGQRYPDVTTDITNRVEKGCLVINYIGHGGEQGWAHERILSIPDIEEWNNDRLPLFMTATCEFSRFDDPEKNAAGELVLLNSRGGGIALLTTVRVVVEYYNNLLNQSFFYNVFKPIGTRMPRLGEVYRSTKRDVSVYPNTRNFTLLGDPAITLNYPGERVLTSTINNIPVTSTIISQGTKDPSIKSSSSGKVIAGEKSFNAPALAEQSFGRSAVIRPGSLSMVVSQADTIRGLSKVTVSGQIADKGGNLDNAFSGTIYSTIYDKAVNTKTLANDGGTPTPFTTQKNVLYKGKATVTSGTFTFSFIVPKDVGFNIGKGRFSYYADNGGTRDAAGYYDNIYVGGIASNLPQDNTGPEVKLYLNDSKFVFGGITDQNPKLYAVLRDTNGINTVGNGIGHDLVANLDNSKDNIYVLNDYYESDLNSYQSGKVVFPLKSLKEGRHSLRLKAWDVFNNSSEGYTEFVVASSAKFALDHVLNYPNPFTTHTSFFFEHNHPGVPLSVQIQIYTISGRLVKTINTTMASDSFRSDPIEWDGRDDFGDPIGRGVYVYKLKVQASDGAAGDKYQKLVILK